MAYITDIMIIQGKDAKVPDGFTKLPQDLRKGAKGDYFYLCYRKDPRFQGEPVTDITVSDRESLSGFDRDDHQPNKSKNYRLYFRKGILGITDANAIEDVTIMSSKSKGAPTPAGFTKIDCDLNYKQGGDYVYICYKKSAPAAKTPLLWEWMKHVEDGRSIADLSIPGTHDSAMWESNMETEIAPIISARTQYLDISQQFRAGVRFFDFRIYWDKSKKRIGMCHVADVGVGHIGAYSHIGLRDAFNELGALLREHPTEGVFVWITVEQDIKNEALVASDKVKKYVQEVKGILKDFSRMIYVDEGRPIDRSKRLPRLKDLRGKMMLISDAVGKGYALGSGSVHLADGYKYDPWRLRYIKSEGGRDVFDDLGDSGKHEKVMSGDSFFAGGTNKAKDGPALAEHIRNANLSDNRGKMTRFSSTVAFDLKHDPYHSAIKINPALIKYLREHPVSPYATGANRVGVGSMDFVGLNESLWLGFELVRQNPDIARMLAGR